MRGAQTIIRKWAGAEEGLAAVEVALVFPILLVLLMGTFDMGNAILANTKTIRSSQVVADLVTRERNISTSDLNEAIEAGRLAFEPLDDSSFGVDVVSIRFDSSANPQIVWRETRNMVPDPDVLERVDTLAEAGNGVVVVNVHYNFEPFFINFVVGDISMGEIAFARGRKSAVVERE